MALFEQRLNSLREEIGLSQTEVARQLNISNQALYHYEHGREPNYETLMKIAVFYNTTTDYLVGLSNIRKPKDFGPTDVKNKSIVIDFTEATELEDNLKKHNVEHRDIAKLMCFGEIFEEGYKKYLKSEVFFEALPIDAMHAILDYANSVSTNLNSDVVARSCMKLGIKLQIICEKLYSTYLKKLGGNTDVKEE